MPAQKPASSTSLIGVLLDVVDDARAPGWIRVSALEHVEDQARALELVLEMRRVDEDQLVVPRGEVDVHFEHLQFVARILVQPDFADAEHVGPVEELRDDRDDVLARASRPRIPSD